MINKIYNCEATTGREEELLILMAGSKVSITSNGVTDKMVWAYPCGPGCAFSGWPNII